MQRTIPACIISIILQRSIVLEIQIPGPKAIASSIGLQGFTLLLSRLTNHQNIQDVHNSDSAPGEEDMNAAPGAFMFSQCSRLHVASWTHKIDKWWRERSISA
jgi:hypothetical protein